MFYGEGGTRQRWNYLEIMPGIWCKSNRIIMILQKNNIMATVKHSIVIVVELVYTYFLI